MESKISLLSWLLLLTFSLFISQIASQDNRQAYIVYMGSKPKGQLSTSTLHMSMLRQVAGRNFGPESLLYHYRKSFDGFVVKLIEEEAKKMAGFGPPPTKWRGTCQVSANFTCNNKIIGAKYYRSDRSFGPDDIPVGKFQHVGPHMFCNENSLDKNLVKGKIVLCDLLDTGEGPFYAGAAGAVIQDTTSRDYANNFPLPTSYVNNADGSNILTYIKSNSQIASQDNRQAYIVYMGSKPKGQLSTSALHMSMLRQVAGRNVGPESLLYHYGKSFDGFVVKLTEEEAKKMAGMSGVVSVFPNRQLKLHTTRSWDFMGFSQKVERATTESDVIIGVIDTGIWPESESFNDTGFGPPPTKWRGTCQVSANFTCNNKIIGAKYYRSDGSFGPDNIPSPRDSNGHGTHTASTAAGNLVQLGNNIFYEGISINTVDLTDTTYPLIYGGDTPNVTGGFSYTSSRFCNENSLDKNLVKGKIVLCDFLLSGKGPFYAGAAGAVIQDTFRRDHARNFPLPTSYVNRADGSNILIYIKSNSNASATIFKSTQGNDTKAPYVVSFSSRGPNPITLDILKPDITAPGVNILAAWTPLNSVSGVKGDNRFVPYNMISGTSMSCPHVSAIAAYIKSFHPTWSPAAIKSAIMTTATSMSATKNPEAEFAYGDNNSTCDATTSAKVWDLNYPSFALSTSPSETNFTRIFNRVVTNVGTPVSTYRASVTGAPIGLRILLNPSVLSFTSLGQTLSFTLIVEGTIVDPMVSASLVWDDGVHQVRSPIVVFVVS
ncbi:hypothetical protein LWI29_000567 [Acer saccharum]|uniref:Cucumisin n=1 Tax=Acer saccharum TaxID=4024 RepID=A0AA39RA30_ACESA|nr:hypothetical protein LWI29_000567 [Acer saccharum]